MGSPQDHFRILYEIALDVGVGRTLKPMLERAVGTLLRKLDCSGAVVFQDRWTGGRWSAEETLSMPPGFGEDPACASALGTPPAGGGPGSGRTEWEDLRPISAGLGLCYGLDLAGFGFLALFNSTPLEPSLLRSLRPICDRLGEACLACASDSESETRYRALFEGAGDAIFLTTPEVFKECNQAALEMFGCRPEDIIGRPPTEFSPPTQPDGRDSAEKAREKIAAAVSGTPQRFEWRHQKLDGTPFDADVTLNLVELPSGPHILATVRDVSERKGAERAIAEERGLSDMIIDSLPGVFYVLDQEGRFLRWNASFEVVSGYSSEEMSRAKGVDFFRGEDQKLIAERIQRVFETGHADAEASLVAKDGREMPYYLTGKRIEYQGQPCLIGMGIDITERRQAEEERARWEEQFHQTQRIESIGRLAGGVAHDLNNLLSPILGYTEMLLEDLPGDRPQRDPLRQILNAGWRARDLVRQLLAFSRRQTLEFKSIDLNQLLKDFESLLRRTIREDIAIHLVLADSLPPIQGDMVQIEQVIMNLTINAQDAMPDGGEIFIETARADLDEGYARDHEGVEPGSFVLLAVSDTGAGFVDEAREHLFEPFFTTKGTDGGTGLGLATVHGIVKQHGGHIWAYSEPECGATFKLYFPASNDRPDSSVPAAQPRTGLLGTETVMLVEDNEHVRKLVLAMLERQGYAVLSAAGGKEAMEIIESREGPLHLLLTDVVMPGINGKELFERASGIYPDLKVLYMSGYTDNIITHRGVIDAGVQFIQKPFAVVALAAKVREVLDL